MSSEKSEHESQAKVLEPQGDMAEPDIMGATPPTQMRLKSASFIITVVSLTLCMFCVALDNNVIVTAIPRITDEFHSVKDIGWYGSAYLLPSCAFQLPSGKLFSRYSGKLVFLCALLLFEIGSLICALAPNSVAFIIGRAISGVGASAVQSGYLIIISLISPPEKRPLFQSLSGAMFGVSAVCGPLIGGAFTDRVTWRWCFYINLPIGGVAGVLLFFFLRTPTPDVPKLPAVEIIKDLDPQGCILFLAGIVCLIQALEWGGVMHPWSDWRLIVLLVLFGVLLVGFCVDQYFMGDKALVPPRMAKQRTVVATSWFGLFLFGSFIANTYFIPIYFQAVTGAGAETAGIRMIPLVAVNVATLIVVGALVTKVGYFVPFFIACSAVSAVGCGLMTTWQVDSTTGVWVGYQLVAGVGSGLAMQLPAVAVQAVLPGHEVSMGIATVLTFQFLGAAVFVSVCTNILNSLLIQYIRELSIPGLDVSTLVQAGVTSVRSSVGPEYVPAVLEAYMRALQWCFRVSLIFACISIIGSLGMEWKRVEGATTKNEEATEIASSETTEK